VRPQVHLQDRQRDCILLHPQHEHTFGERNVKGLTCGCYFGTLFRSLCQPVYRRNSVPSKETVMNNSRRAETKKKLWGRSNTRYLGGGGKLLYSGSQTMPACLSHKHIINVSTLGW
jgi:hypothetical protein